MITLLLHMLRLLPFLCGGHRQLAIENLALRQQLVVYKRTAPRPRLRPTDRLGRVLLARVGPAAGTPRDRDPDMLLRWQRRRFREYWTKLSGSTTGSRPPINAEIRALITRIATANPLWGAPRIHGELLKLGIDVAERTVSRLIPKRRTPPSQTWPTFLTPVQDLVSIDFFVPTSAACALRPGRPRPPAAPGPSLQRHRVSHRRVDRPADRGYLPGRHCPRLSPP